MVSQGVPSLWVGLADQKTLGVHCNRPESNCISLCARHIFVRKEGWCLAGGVGHHSPNLYHRQYDKRLMKQPHYAPNLCRPAQVALARRRMRRELPHVFVKTPWVGHRLKQPPPRADSPSEPVLPRRLLRINPVGLVPIWNVIAYRHAKCITAFGAGR